MILSRGEALAITHFELDCNKAYSFTVSLKVSKDLTKGHRKMA